MSRRSEAEPATVQPTFREWRLLPPAFGVQPAEDRVIQADSPPSANSEQVADGTPLHDWAPSRQWLPHAGPYGWDPSALATVDADTTGERPPVELGG